MLKGWGISLRMLVYLRTIARELTRANDLAEYRLKREYPDYRKLELNRKTPKLVDIDKPTAADWSHANDKDNERWGEIRITDD